MTELQEKALELLKIFVNICDKWNIRYYLVCGSALGAVKYRGFIPWDDDIDVALLRADYDRFLEVAPGELPDWCFLQNYKTDRRFPHVYSKLRNSNTTFIEEGVAELPINHGIYIDIFPLDGQPAQPAALKRFMRKKKLLGWIPLSALKDDRKRKVRLRNGFFRLLGLHKKTDKALERLERLYRSYPPENLWCNYGNWQGSLDYSPSWHYGKGRKASFEGLEVVIPENYDAYLSRKYQDWRKDPPLEKQVSHHTHVVCDARLSYKEYLSGSVQTGKSIHGD